MEAIHMVPYILGRLLGNFFPWSSKSTLAGDVLDPALGSSPFKPLSWKANDSLNYSQFAVT